MTTNSRVVLQPLCFAILAIGIVVVPNWVTSVRKLPSDVDFLNAQREARALEEAETIERKAQLEAATPSQEADDSLGQQTCRELIQAHQALGATVHGTLSSAKKRRSAAKKEALAVLSQGLLDYDRQLHKAIFKLKCGTCWHLPTAVDEENESQPPGPSEDQCQQWATWYPRLACKQFRKCRKRAVRAKAILDTKEYLSHKYRSRDDVEHMLSQHIQMYDRLNTTLHCHVLL